MSVPVPLSMEYGPKAMLELWYNLDQTQWTSLNLSFTTAHKTASARWRYGVKVMPGLSVGTEIRFDTNDLPARRVAATFFDHYLARTGLFASYKWEEGIEVSVAGGIGSHLRGVQREPNNSDVTPYATVQFAFPVLNANPHLSWSPCCATLASPDNRTGDTDHAPKGPTKHPVGDVRRGARDARCQGRRPQRPPPAPATPSKRGANNRVFSGLRKPRRAPIGGARCARPRVSAPNMPTGRGPRVPRSAA